MEQYDQLAYLKEKQKLDASYSSILQFYTSSNRKYLTYRINWSFCTFYLLFSQSHLPSCVKTKYFLFIRLHSYYPNIQIKSKNFVFVKIINKIRDLIVYVIIVEQKQSTREMTRENDRLHTLIRYAFLTASDRFDVITIEVSFVSIE